jgi:hypothetical protein
MQVSDAALPLAGRPVTLSHSAMCRACLIICVAEGKCLPGKLHVREQPSTQTRALGASQVSSFDGCAHARCSPRRRAPAVTKAFLILPGGRSSLGSSFLDVVHTWMRPHTTPQFMHTSSPQSFSIVLQSLHPHGVFGPAGGSRNGVPTGASPVSVSARHIRWW